MGRRSIAASLVLTASFAVLIATAQGTVEGSKKEGQVEYIGAQKTIFVHGKASAVIDLDDLSGRKGLYAMGPIEGLDGEITILDSKAYVTRIRGTNCVVDNSYNHKAFCLVWTEQKAWRDVPVPANVKGYVDLQNFIKAQAQAAGMDMTKPFPFLLAGAPVEIKWHVNVDRTEGKPITRDTYLKSQDDFVTKSEPVDIVGFYSEKHPGIFVSQYAPAITLGSGLQNFMHVHVVSKNGKAAGHVDDLTLADGMVLRLPK